MTDFNALPLAEKLKQAQRGDIFVTDSGARLPLHSVIDGMITVVIEKGNTIWLARRSITDIIRPEPEKVPEIVDEIYEIIERCKHESNLSLVRINSDLIDLAGLLADHFEQEPPK